MGERHTVVEGDCVFRIAAENGIPWERLWNDPQNEELRRERKSPSILHVGDVLYVPDKEIKEETKGCEQKHRFRLQRPWVEIRLTIEEFGVPRDSEPYYVLADDVRYEGDAATTDAEGKLTCRIPPNTERAIVVLGEEETEEFELTLGCVDPIETGRGKQVRLQNLGYYEGPVDGGFGPMMALAFKDFLSHEGEPNAAITDEEQANREGHLSKLEDGYGS